MKPLYRIVGFTLLLDALVGVVIGIQMYLSYQAINRETSVKVGNLSQLVANELESLLGKVEIAFTAVSMQISGNLTNPQVDFDLIHHILKYPHASNSVLSGIFIADEEGLVVGGTESVPGAIRDISDREYFKAQINEQNKALFVSKPIQSRLDSQWSIVLSLAMRDVNGEFKGIIFGLLTLKNLEKYLASIQLAKHGVMSLRYNDLSVLVRIPDDPIKKSIGNAKTSETIRDLLKTHPSAGEYTAITLIDGVERNIAYRKVTAFPLYVFVGEAAEDYLETWRAQFKMFVALYLLVIIGSFLLLALYIRNSREVKKEKEVAERYLAVAEIMLVAFDTEANILLVNRKGCEILGYEPWELRGKNWFKVCVPQDEYKPVWDLYQALITGDASYGKTYENHLVCKDGSTRLIAWHNSVVRNEHGEIIGTLSSGEDITDKRKLEQDLEEAAGQLRASERKYRFIVELAPLGIFQRTYAGKYIYTNRTHWEMFDCVSEEDFISTYNEIASRWRDKRAMETFQSQLKASGLVQDFEVETKLAAGKAKWFSLSAFLDKESKVVNGYVVDITERKTAQLLLEGIINSSMDYITLHDPLNFGLIAFNQNTLEYFQKNYDLVLSKGMLPRDLFPEGMAENWMQILRKALTGEVIHFESESSRSHRYFEWHVKMVKEGEAIVGVVTYGRDISERKKSEMELLHYRDHLEELVVKRTAELQEARDVADRANKAKSLFLANMSHELRTPMNAILGFANILMRDPERTQEQERKASIILKSGEHLLSIINDILDLAKIESGKMERDDSDFDLEAFLRDIIDMLRIRAETKGLVLELDISSSYPKYIRADSGKLRQILINLVGNAIKFTDKGSIRIKLWAQAGGNENSQLFFEICDTGVGISPQDQERIFQPFIQAGQHEGTGLGLTISKQYIELLGGSIIVQSKTGEGSCFQFSIQYRSVNEGANVPSNQQTRVVVRVLRAEKYHILVVEDQLENRLLLQSMLEGVGFQAHLCKNGVEGLDCLKNNRIDLVLMDRRMPIMDGIEATQKIRVLKGYESTPIIAVTAQAYSEEKKEMLAAGCNSILRKPFTEADLLSLIEELLDIDIEWGGGELEGDTVGSLQLFALSQSLRDEIKTAAQGLNQEVLEKILENHPEIPENLQSDLRDKIRNFDFNAILDALKT